MSVRPYRDIHRRKSRKIYVGKVPVGGDAPITVQPMTTTLTSDAVATLAHISTPMMVSAIGCVVNGPGEARETDIGFTGGGNNTHQVYVNGMPDHRLKDGNIVNHLVAMIEKKAAEIEAAKLKQTDDAA